MCSAVNVHTCGCSQSQQKSVCPSSLTCMQIKMNKLQSTKSRKPYMKEKLRKSGLPTPSGTISQRASSSPLTHPTTSMHPEPKMKPSSLSKYVFSSGLFNFIEIQDVLLRNSNQKNLDNAKTKTKQKNVEKKKQKKQLREKAFKMQL